MGNGGPDDDESPLAPSIPSFASLRAARRPSPADLLMSRPPTAHEPDPAPDPAPDPRSPRPGASHPPEWADLWHLGLRIVRWCVQQPIVTVRRLVG